MQDRSSDRPERQDGVGRAHRAEIVDRLYDVALDPVRLEDLLEVWEGRLGPLREGALDAVVPLDDPEIEAHVRRATVFLDRFEASRPETGYRSVLQDIPRSAAFLSDGGPLVVACNRPAEVAFGLREGGPLTDLPFEAEDLGLLRGVIRKVAAGKAEKVITLRVRSTVTGSPVIVRVGPVAPSAGTPSAGAPADGTSAAAPSPGAAASGGPPLALVMSTELVWPEGFELIVQEAFGLTAAEVEIVRGITLGLPVRDIAEARGRSAETVRTQLRSILSKTETHSQSELVRVVLGLMDVALIPSGGQAGPRPARGLEPRPFRSLRLPDGRRLDWIEFGAPDGAPCLYMHLDYGLIRWPAAAERAARKRGIRVVVPVRAGYGSSDPLPRAADHVDGVARDYAAVLDHLGLERAAVLALGADLRFALALAAARPDLVTGILGCAAQLPLRTAAQYDRMDKWQRFILANARYAPKVLPFLVQAGFALARRLGKEAFFAQVNGGSPADMATFARPDVRAAVLEGSDICLSAGRSAHEAFSRECISSERDWSGLVRGCKVPVLLLQGDQDPQSPVQTIRELMTDFPNIEVRFLPNTGQLLFFAEWPQALDALAPFLRPVAAKAQTRIP